MEFLIKLIGLFVLVFTIRPITILVHELGHGIPALLLTKDKVTIYIGSYGDPEKSLNFSFGRLEFFFKYNLFFWNTGLCVPHSKELGFSQQIIFVLFGPLSSLLFGFSICYFTFTSDLLENMGLISTFFLGSALYDFYINIVPNSQPIQLHDGTIVYNDGQRLKQLLKFKTYPKAYEEGIAFYNQQAYDKAAVAFQQVFDSGVKDDTVYRLLISSLLQAKEYESANHLIIEFEQNFTMTSDDYTFAGFIKSELRKGDLGMEDYHKALTLNPKNYAALNNRGYIYILNEQFEKAMTDLDKAVALNPKFAYSFCNRGLAKIKIGQMEEGLIDIRTSIDLDDKNSYAFRNLGIYFFDIGDYDKALENFDKAYQLDKDTHLINEYIQKAKEKKS